MKFGIFYEHQLPRPWEEGSELQLIADALDQIELADRLGIDILCVSDTGGMILFGHKSTVTVSFDEFSATQFLVVPRTQTMPIQIYSMIQTGNYAAVNEYCSFDDKNL